MTFNIDKKEWYTRQITDCQLSLYRLSLGIVRNEQDAQDALQEALLAGYEKLDTLKDPESFRPWMMRIVNNASYDILRRRKNLISLEETENVTAPISTSHSDKILLQEAIMTLPANYRNIVTLFYYEDMTVLEISQITGLSVSVVKTRLFRARQLLRKFLEE